MSKKISPLIRGPACPVGRVGGLKKIPQKPLTSDGLIKYNQKVLFPALDDKFAKIDDKFANIDDSFEKIGGRFAKIDWKFEEIKEEIKEKFDKVLTGQDKILKIIEDLRSEQNSRLLAP